MVNGLLFFEEGGLQPIGQITRLEDLIQNIEAVLPQLRQQAIAYKQQEAQKALEKLSLEELERELKRRK
jgi:hypothetical protein